MKDLVQSAKEAGLSERESCAALGVSRASARKPSATKRLTKQAPIAESVRRSFAQSKQRYGSPRVYQDVREEGHIVSENTVAKIMRQDGLVARMKHSFRPSTTDSNHEHGYAENLVMRNFDVAEPNKVWVGDITYLQTATVWAYLAVVIDLYSRRIVGWTLRTSLHAEGAVEALNQAFRERGGVGVITHHDRGVQYACGDYADILAAHSATLSMSRKGDCWDNAVAESFFSSLKRELGDTFDSFSEAIREVTLYIMWYNAVRRHSHNDGLSPLRAELAYHHAKAA